MSENLSESIDNASKSYSVTQMSSSKSQKGATFKCI